MNRLQKRWLEIAGKLNLKIDVPFRLNFPDKSSIEVDVRIRGYGAKKGMLIISDYSAIKKKQQEIIDMGYGFTCLSQPAENEQQSIDSFVELLNDWGKIT